MGNLNQPVGADTSRIYDRVYLWRSSFRSPQLFYGISFEKVWGCLLGLAVGGAGGAAAGYYILNDWMLALAAGAGCALIVCFLAWVFYKLGVFVMCTGLVYFMVITMLDAPSMMTHLVVLGHGVFAGTLALGYERQLVIAITALCGGIAEWACSCLWQGLIPQLPSFYWGWCWQLSAPLSSLCLI